MARVRLCSSEAVSPRYSNLTRGTRLRHTNMLAREQTAQTHSSHCIQRQNSHSTTEPCGVSTSGTSPQLAVPCAGLGPPPVVDKILNAFKIHRKKAKLLLPLPTGRNVRSHTSGAHSQMRRVAWRGRRKMNKGECHKAKYAFDGVHPKETLENQVSETDAYQRLSYLYLFSNQTWGVPL